LFLGKKARPVPASIENATSQQTVDGLQAALEILARSAYVPDIPIGVRSRLSGDTRPNATRLELPVWMKS
jgi:hypothetical protein